MGYLEDNLMPGEKIIYQTKLHWIVFLWPIIWLVIAILIFTRGGNPELFGSVFTVIAVITGLESFMNYTTSEFGITNKRVIVKVGYIRRNSLEILLTKVEGIQVNQGILGRILGYGSIVVSGTGGMRDPFHNISNPLEFRRKIQEEVSIVQESK